MKKLTVLAVGILMLIMKIHAQTFDTTTYYGKMNYVFYNVDKTPITSGILRDYGIEFLSLDNFPGTVLHDSNYVSLDDWRMLYASLYSSQIKVNAAMLGLDTINRLINNYNYTSMPISFIGLDYNYEKFRDDAITSNLMYVSNDQLFDVSGRAQSPYESKELFAFAPIRQAAVTGNNQFIFRPELFLSNTGKTISSIAYDAAGGSNYQSVAFNTPFTLSYNSTGFYDFNIKVTYSDSSVRYGHTKVVVYTNPQGNSARFGTRPVSNENVTATKAYQNIAGQGDITIDLAQNNTTGQIRKPLIVVEGFDPDGSFRYFNEMIPRLDYDFNYPYPNYYSHPITLNDGLDNTNEYDMIYLHFQNGTDYIQRNAYLLERVIEIVNSRKTTWGGVRQQNVIIGLSMGGLVVRYALRDMELNSQNHETRLFISHDSPHWGANVPVGAQAAVQHLAPWKIINPGIQNSFPFLTMQWVDMFPQAVDAMNLFNTPAAKQMLIQRYTLSGQTLSADNGTHNSFLSEINSMGWPVNCRNITLSNGACTGAKTFDDNSTIFTIDGNRDMRYFGSVWRSLLITLGAPEVAIGVVNGFGNPQFNSWAMLWQFPLSLFSTKSSIGVDFKIRAVPVSGTQEIYRGDVYSKKKILWTINVTNYFIKCHVSSSTDMLPLDNAPGGKYDVNQFGVDAGQIAQQLPSFFQGYVQAVTLQPQFCFVPTVSSLAVNNPQNNLFTNICSNVNCINSASVQDYYAPQQSEIHIIYTQNATNWLLQRQDASFSCAKICAASLAISGDNNFCNTSNSYSISGMSAGGTVQWSISPSYVATINCPTCAQTTLTKSQDGSATLTANITNSCSGDTYQISKSGIGVGSPFPQGTTIASSSYDYYSGSLLSSYSFLVPGGQSGNAQFNVTDPLYSSISWSPVSVPSGSSWYSSGNSINISVSAPSTAWSSRTCTIRMSASGPCGAYTTDFSATAVNRGSGFAMAPNPANSEVTVASDNGSADSKSSSLIYSVKIIDQYGVVRKNLEFKQGLKTIKLPVADLSTGVYQISIFDGKGWTTKQLLIQK